MRRLSKCVSGSDLALKIVLLRHLGQSINKTKLPPPLYPPDTLGLQLTLSQLNVGVRLVDLVESHNERDPRLPNDPQRFYRGKFSKIESRVADPVPTDPNPFAIADPSCVVYYKKISRPSTNVATYRKSQLAKKTFYR